MAMIEQYFENVYDAFWHIVSCAEHGALTEEDAKQVRELVTSFGEDLPSFSYALQIYKDNPELIVNKRAFALACDRYYAHACTIDVMRAFDSPDFRTSNGCASAQVELVKAVQYISWVLWHTHQRLCRLSSPSQRR